MAIHIKNIRKVGDIAQTMAMEDFQRNGFITYDSMRAGYDFVAILLDTEKRIVQHMFVEIKKIPNAGNVRKLSKVQENFRKLCKLTHVDHLIYYVTSDQMEYWLQSKKPVTLDNFIYEKGGEL